MMPHGWPYDCLFDKYTDEELLATTYKRMDYLDRADLYNLIAELVKRWQDAEANA